MASKASSNELGDTLYEDKVLNTASFPDIASSSGKANDFKAVAQTVMMVVLVALGALALSAGIIWVSKYIGINPEIGRSIFIRFAVLLTAFLFLLRARITRWKENILFILLGLFWTIHPVLDFWTAQ